MAETMNDLLTWYDEAGAEIGMVYGYRSAGKPFFMAQWVDGEWAISVSSGNFDSASYVRALEFTGHDLMAMLLENTTIYNECYKIAKQINDYQEELDGMGLMLYFYGELNCFVARTGEYGIFEQKNVVRSLNFESQDEPTREIYYAFLVALRDMLEEVFRNLQGC